MLGIVRRWLGQEVTRFDPSQILCRPVVEVNPSLDEPSILQLDGLFPADIFGWLGEVGTTLLIGIQQLKNPVRITQPVDLALDFVFGTGGGDCARVVGHPVQPALKNRFSEVLGKAFELAVHLASRVAPQGSVNEEELEKHRRCRA